MNLIILRIIKLILAFGLVVLGAFFEKFSNERFNVFVLACLVYLIINFLIMFIYKIKSRDEKSELIVSGLLLFELSQVFLMEESSRYAVNFFIHMLYIFTVLDIGFTIRGKIGYYIGGVSLIVSIYSFLKLAVSSGSFGAYSQLLFFSFMMISIFLLSVALKFYDKEKKKVQGLYDELRLYSDKLESLTIINERNRISSELHDSLGHDMTGLIMQLEMTKYLLDSGNHGNAMNLVEKSLVESRNMFKNVRGVVEAIESGGNDLSNVIKEFSKKTGIHVVVNNIELIDTFDKAKKEQLWKIVREALTNSVKHSKPSKIQVDLVIQDNICILNIFDFSYSNEKCQDISGISIDNINEGFGIKNMRRRIESIGGSLEYGFHDINGSGFKIICKLPIKY